MKKSMILLKKMIQSIADKTAFVAFSPEGVASDFENLNGVLGDSLTSVESMCVHTCPACEFDD